MSTYNEIVKKASKAGFEDYSDVRHPDGFRITIMTCLKGEHDGEVLDIWYNDGGKVIKAEVTSQFNQSHPHYRTPTFRA